MDLTTGQLRAVPLLYTNGPLRMSDISSSLGVSMATATGVMDRVVERGIVVRESDPNDRRIVRCRVSREGEEFVSGLWRAWSERAKVLLAVLDRPRLLAIRGFLEALLEAGENTKGQWMLGRLIDSGSPLGTRSPVDRRTRPCPPFVPGAPHHNFGLHTRIPSLV